MTILPLVERELKVAIRRPYAYRVRMAAAVGAMVIAIWGLWVWSSWIAGASVGHSLFRIIATIAFVGSLGSGLVLTADSISQERREGTLGLLFLTDLRSADVVFGKLTAKAFLPFYALLASLPALAIFTVVGGVTGGELWRTMLALTNALFVSLAVALFTSVFCVEQRLAHALAFLAIAGVTGASISSAPTAPLLPTTTIKSLITSLNLTTTFAFAEEQYYRAAPFIFFASLIGTHVLGWASLVFACALLPGKWREQKGATKGPDSLAWPRGSTRGAEASSAGKECLDTDPIKWLGNRHRWRPLTLWCLPLLALLGWVGISLRLRGGAQATALLAWVAATQIALRLWIAMDASHTFGASRRDGTLESLLGTPLLPSEIGEGMVRALRKRFFWPGVVMAMIGLGACVQSSAAGHSIVAAVLLVATLTLAFDISCIGWVGLWRGLAAAGSTAAIVSTIGRTMMLPMAWFAILRGLFHGSPAGDFIGIYFVLALVNNLFFRSSARSRLDQHFRTLALRPYGGKIPHMESKWSPINWEGELIEGEGVLR